LSLETIAWQEREVCDGIQINFHQLQVTCVFALVKERAIQEETGLCLRLPHLRGIPSRKKAFQQKTAEVYSDTVEYQMEEELLLQMKKMQLQFTNVKSMRYP
jgi:hypothetical protein